MSQEIIYIFASVIGVSLISVLMALPLILKKNVSQSFLLSLMSLSVGSLLGGAFIHFIPEAMEHGYHLETGLFVLLGFIVFFIIEHLIHWKHQDCKGLNKKVHDHAYHLAPINLIGDGIHNALDGLVIAGSYLVSIPLGIAATISIVLHEVPQEIADFGILLYSGWSKKKAVFFNFVSASTAIIGAIVGVVLSGAVHEFNNFIIPFAAGNFVYIAAANLVPELHRQCGIKKLFLHLFMIVVGITIMALIAMMGGHAH